MNALHATHSAPLPYPVRVLTGSPEGRTAASSFILIWSARLRFGMSELSLPRPRAAVRCSSQRVTPSGTTLLSRGCHLLTSGGPAPHARGGHQVLTSSRFGGEARRRPA